MVAAMAALVLAVVMALAALADIVEMGGIQQRSEPVVVVAAGAGAALLIFVVPQLIKQTQVLEAEVSAC
jgi:hypothetical protein